MVSHKHPKLGGLTAYCLYLLGYQVIAHCDAHANALIFYLHCQMYI
jgi:hypothetical protein